MDGPTPDGKTTTSDIHSRGVLSTRNAGYVIGNFIPTSTVYAFPKNFFQSLVSLTINVLEELRLVEEFRDQFLLVCSTAEYVSPRARDGEELTVRKVKP